MSKLTHKEFKSEFSSIINALHLAGEKATALARRTYQQKDPMPYLSDAAELITTEKTSGDSGRKATGVKTEKLFRLEMDRQFAEACKAAKVGATVHQYTFQSRKGVVTVLKTPVEVTAEMHESKKPGKEATEQGAANRQSQQESERNAALSSTVNAQKEKLSEALATVKRLRAELKKEQAARKKAEQERDALRAEWSEAMAKTG